MAGQLDVGFAAERTGMTRRDFLKGTGMMGAACLVAPLLSCGSHSESGGYGTIIRNGTVYDGTLAEPIKADVGIVGDRIVAVGNLTGSTCKVIDAQNCIVTPGFIDVHDHSDLMFLNAGADRELARTLPVWSENQAALIQGVTTVISGNCGYGFTDMNEYYTFLNALPFGSNHNDRSIIYFRKELPPSINLKSPSPNCIFQEDFIGKCEQFLDIENRNSYSTSMNKKTNRII